MKTELAQHRVRLNVAAFYHRYKNIQVQEIVSGATISLNAAAAERKGIDVDFAFRPTDALTVRGGFELMNDHYTVFHNAPFNDPHRRPERSPHRR
jgi:iron complex outermembrane receptor protein